MSQPSKPKQKDIWQNEMLTVMEVAAYLRISRVTVWRWCRQGIIPAIQVGRSWRIHRDDLLHISKPHYLSIPLLEPNLNSDTEESF